MANKAISVSPSRTFLYDRVFEVTLSPDKGPSLKIGKRKGGIKPDITFSVSELPQNKCYQVELNIRNLGLKNDQLRTYTQMEITAGYQGISDAQPGEQQTFSCSIFTAYCESPNPDGITVITGIVVGDIVGVMETTQMTLEVRSAIPWKQVVEEVGKKLRYNINFYLPEDLMYELPTKGSFKTSFDNGWQAIMWLQLQLFEYGKNVLHTPIFLTVWNKTLSIFTLTEALNVTTLTHYGIVNLSAITRASFAGPKLDVIAPWVPSLIPGGIFHMSPTYYQASNLPNMLPKASYTNKRDLYYVIVMDVKFGTRTGNQMHITAVPVQYVIPKDGKLDYTEDTVVMSKMGDLRQTYLTKHKDQVVELVLGEGKKAETLAQELNNYWNAATDGNFQGILGVESTIVKQGWSQRARDLIYYQGIWKYSRARLVERYGLSNYKKICKEAATGINATQDPILVPMVYFWPLLPLGTYWKYKANGNKGPIGTRLSDSGTDDVLKVDMYNPDKIDAYIKIWVPAIDISMADSGQLDTFGDALVAFGKYYTMKYKDDKENHDKYVFGQETYKAGICLGGWKE